MTVAGILEPDLGVGGSLLSMITRVPQFLVTLTGYCDIFEFLNHIVETAGLNARLGNVLKE